MENRPGQGNSISRKSTMINCIEHSPQYMESSKVLKLDQRIKHILVAMGCLHICCFCLFRTLVCSFTILPSRSREVPSYPLCSLVFLIVHILYQGCDLSSGTIAVTCSPLWMAAACSLSWFWNNHWHSISWIPGWLWTPNRANTVLNSWPSCVSLFNARIKDMGHHTWFT